MVSNSKPHHYFSSLAVLAVALMGVLMMTVATSPANAYLEAEASFEGAKKFGDEFCASRSDAQVGDLVWLTAMDGSKTIVVEPGQVFVPIIVHAGGKYCSTWVMNTAGSNYTSDVGGVNGRIDYPATGANTYFQTVSPNQKYLNVTGYGSGGMRVCMSLTTYTDPSGIERPSPNACTNLTLVVKKAWSINGQSYVRNNTTGGPRSQGTITANLNDVVYWDHDMRNNGPDDMDRDVYYNVDKTGYAGSEAGINGNKAQNGFARGVADPLLSLFVKLYAPNSPHTVKTIYQHDVGAGYDRPPICQRIAWQDKAWNDGTWGWSVPWACVRVPYNYNLIPGVSGVSGVVSASSPISSSPVMSSVNNALPNGGGATTVSEMAHWERWRIEVPPGGSIPMSRLESGATPCAHYGDHPVCEAKGSGDQVFEATNTPLPELSGEMVDADTPVGTKICYTVSVRPYSQVSDTEWRHSAPACVTVSKQPKVQVWGSDVRTRGSITTSTSRINDAGTDKLFGSWVEYGGFSVGSNSGFASGAGLSGGTTNTTTASTWHQLTFANADKASPCTDGFGCYTLDELPTITDQFIGAPSPVLFNSNLGALPSGTYAVDDVTIEYSAVGQEAGIGKSIIIVSSGTVTINGDITYTGASGDSFTALNQIPQVVIIANRINIAESVSRVDAWLLTRGADGVINTCHLTDRSETAALNSSLCDTPLTVNGPVAASHLYLRRTAGSDDVTTAGAPAETFNLRPDAYIWAYARASQAGKAQTVDTVEMPPRF